MEFSPVQTESLHDRIAQCLMTHTPSLLPMAERLAMTTPHDVTVLLNGETGTGKTFLARLIHDHSPRRDERFLAVPCGALANNLFESELFGHAKGAFTGAHQPREGKFAAAGRGTLLLDEIDTLSLEQQATLLHVIETGEFDPVGSNATQKCAATLIVASNVELEKAIAQGTFRADLYFRLNVMSFYLPPLRERLQDIAPLARAMLVRFASRFSKPLTDIHPLALAALEVFPWPGNIRQLENAMQHAVLVSTGPELRPENLPPEVQACYAKGNEPICIHGKDRLRAESLHDQCELQERNVIQRALITNNYNRVRTAAALCISRAGLYKKMKKYGLAAKERRRDLLAGESRQAAAG